MNKLIACLLLAGVLLGLLAGCSTAGISIGGGSDTSGVKIGTSGGGIKAGTGSTPTQ